MKRSSDILNKPFSPKNEMNIITEDAPILVQEKVLKVENEGT